MPTLLLAAAAASLAACGEGPGTGKPTTQVAARVNKDEITVHQVQAVLQRRGSLATGQPALAARQVLDGLVEQQLAAQAAREQKLQRDPSVVQELQAAEREILARAYQDRIASQATGPSSDEIDRYYESQPALFAERRLYTLQEHVVDVPDDGMARLDEIVSSARGASDLAQKLKSTGLPHRTRYLANAAEDIPLGLLNRLQPLSAGQSVLLRQPQRVAIYCVLHAEPASVDRRMARDVIATFLLNQRRRELVQQGMAALRRSAKIEYVGTFAEAASAPQPQASRGTP